MKIYEDSGIEYTAESRRFIYRGIEFSKEDLERLLDIVFGIVGGGV